MSNRNDLVNALTSEDGQFRTTEDAKAMLDAYRAAVLKEAAAICRAQAPKYLDNEVDMAIFWALDSAAGKIVAGDKT